MSIPHLDDDALSATLDGEATPEEVAHVESCDTCRARVEALRQAARLIGGPVEPLDPVRRESAIAAALAAADDAPVSLAAHRRQRNIPAWLIGAAALVLLAVLVVPGLVSGPGEAPDQTAARDSSGAGAAAPEAADDPLTAGVGGEDAATLRATVAPVDVGDLGAVDEAALSDAVRAGLDAPPESAAPAADSSAALSTMAPACEDELRAAVPGLEALRVTGVATVDGTETRVLAFEQADGDSRTLVVYAVDAADCVTVLARLELPLP